MKLKLHQKQKRYRKQSPAMLADIEIRIPKFRIMPLISGLKNNLNFSWKKVGSESNMPYLYIRRKGNGSQFKNKER
jgi:hypothetical protein